MCPSSNFLWVICDPLVMNNNYVRKRKLHEDELRQLLENIWDDSSDEPFQDSGSEYLPSDSDSDFIAEMENNDVDTANEELPCPPSKEPIQTTSIDDIEWFTWEETFQPRMSLCDTEIVSVPTVNLDRSCKEMDVFLKVFPKSLLMYIAQCTNLRLDIHSKQIKKPIQRTDAGEIAIVIGTLLIMSYHKLPNMHCYWSTRKSLGNDAVKAAISRDRFMLLHSKMYFNVPEKPADCGKTFYIDELLSCLKYTFMKCRTDSQFQSIDEAMAKFKGRSTLKQYLPLKPIKRGIKLWVRSDAITGYAYDVNIYVGKETENVEGTLGERVVKKLCQTVTNSNISICFDRFFTSVKLLNDLQICAVGTCMSRRKHMPVFEKSLEQKGNSEILVSNTGLLAVKWKDTKEVTFLSNCHDGKITTTIRKNKQGKLDEVAAPDAAVFYNNYMGGVDLSDQMVTLYDIDRKSAKWWKKVFYRLLLQAVVNCWIIYKDIHHTNIPLLQFIVPLAEDLIDYGKQNAAIKRRRQYGRPSASSRGMKNPEHLPINGPRRRCHNCHKNKIEKRTTISCSTCNIALCINCYKSYHS